MPALLLLTVQHQRKGEQAQRVKKIVIAAADIVIKILIWAAVADELQTYKQAGTGDSKLFCLPEHAMQQAVGQQKIAETKQYDQHKCRDPVQLIIKYNRIQQKNENGQKGALPFIIADFALANSFPYHCREAVRLDPYSVGNIAETEIVRIGMRKKAHINIEAAYRKQQQDRKNC